jgi:hypothetical protein
MLLLFSASNVRECCLLKYIALTDYSHSADPAHSVKRTVGFAILGALAPIGYNLGGLFSALIGVKIGCDWIFFITYVLCLSMRVCSFR